MNIISRIIKKVYYESSSKRMISFYKKKGVVIGEETIILNPRNIIIDYSRPELVKIGKHVFLHNGTCILSHDWASWVFIKKYGEFIPSHGKVVIGDNVWLGENVTILKGVTIGDNVIIGIGSVVTKDIPSNTVAVGSPARVIYKLDDYFERRKKEYVSEVLEYGSELLKSGKGLKEDYFYDDYPVFVDGTNCHLYNYPYDRVFDKNDFKRWKEMHQKEFESYEDFVSKIKNNI